MNVRLVSMLTVAVGISMSGCGGGGGATTPVAPSAVPVPMQVVTAIEPVTGRVVGFPDESALAGVIIESSGLEPVESGPDGGFTLPAETAGQRVLLTRLGYVTRETVMTPGAVISMIPDDFDLSGFDGMARGSAGFLQRWTQPPGLVMVTAVLDFTSVEAMAATAVSDAGVDADASGIVDDVSWALPHLTGNRFEHFRGVVWEQAPPGTHVTLARAGQVTVARFRGLRSATGFVAYGRWASAPDGSVSAGLIYLDEEYDRSSANRQYVRMHELGHALGYSHVEGRASVMNAQPRFEPTAFDRDVASLAFQRPPGNRAPDVDPPVTRMAALTGFDGGLDWAAPVP